MTARTRGSSGAPLIERRCLLLGHIEYAGGSFRKHDGDLLLGEGDQEWKPVLRKPTDDEHGRRRPFQPDLDESVTERSWLPSKGQVGFSINLAVRMRPPASPDENNGAVGEFFWDGAASTPFWVDPANDLTAILFVQLIPFDQVGLHKAFRDTVYGRYIPPSAAAEQ